ncbi:hypothetical protein A8O14_06345 [Polynucleobacter wuianus]|uniref:Porin n=1 Tax=Polynucleobacter wuianus TaxID=1743168 RepID=A0A191UFC2_9BURK|nr:MULTISPECIES: outer membrane beta-barrel protein [Polynucleobacter]ANI99729.1 hypothetical protein A8O14_06345 [Polynucleobacter wuianus]MBU3552530.1 outer membrane beta-barrel protein [Polynucleobacter sp. MWH-Post4-6-1]
MRISSYIIWATLSGWIYSFSVFGQNAPEDQPLSSAQPLSTQLLITQPFQLEFAPLGSVNISAVVSGIGMAQTNAVPNDYHAYADLANAQLVLQKETGLIQFYLQGGYYSTPSLGTTYQRASLQTKESFGVLPLASVSVVPDTHWRLSAGKINSFGGYENTFTYQNSNIDRGLLWNQTSNVSKGFEVSYREGALSSAITLNDGFYSNQLSWMGASLGYQLNARSDASMVWTGAIKANSTNTFITPLFQNNSQIFNAIYSYRADHWSVTPYLQYTYVPANPSIGILSSAQTMGAAVLTSYQVTRSATGGFTLPLRLEYIGSGNKTQVNTPNLLYGPRSAAWSATITPTYQYQRTFIRGELSYVQAVKTSAGQAFGAAGNATNQARIMLEMGFLY